MEVVGEAVEVEALALSAAQRAEEAEVCDPVGRAWVRAEAVEAVVVKAAARVDKAPILRW